MPGLPLVWNPLWLDIWAPSSRQNAIHSSARHTYLCSENKDGLALCSQVKEQHSHYCNYLLWNHLSPSLSRNSRTHTQKHGSCLLSDISDGWVDGWIDPVSHLVYLASPHLLYSQSKAAITLSAGNVHHTWALRTVRLRGVGGTRVVLAARAWAHSS